LPPLVAVEKKALSSMRNSPRISIGLPSTDGLGAPYFKETKMSGRDSVPSTKYNPSNDFIKNKYPAFSMPTSERFYKPTSVSRL